MERHVDAGKRDGGKSALELDVALGLLLLLRLVETVCNDISQHLLDLLNSEVLSELN